MHTEKGKHMAKLTRKQITEGLDQIPIDSLLLGARTETRLTPKQKEFARKIANGTSQVTAYRESYNTKGKKATQRSEASKLAAQPLVAQTVEAFKRAREFSEQHTAAQLRAFVIQQLTQHAMNEDNPPAQQIKALQLLGTVAEVGAFVDRKEVVNVSASQDIRSRLMDKLKSIGAGVSEGSFTERPEESADSLLEELQDRPTPDEDGQPDHGERPELPASDPTHLPPPTSASTTLIETTHSIPLTRSQVPLTQSPTILTGTISSDNSDTVINQSVTSEETLHETYSDIEDAVFTDTPGCSSE